MSWETARQTCVSSHNADLATITSAAENTFAYILAGKQITWIGGSDRKTEGTFTWSDGTPWDKEQLATLWGKGEPNNSGGNEDCIDIFPIFSGLFNDAACSLKYQFICEKKLSYSGKLKKNNLLATIDSWGPYFKLSLDLKIHSKVYPGWSSILSFKGNGGLEDWKKYGDRAPAILYNKNGQLHFTNAVSGNLNYVFDKKVDLGKWYHIEIEQNWKNGKVILSYKSTVYYKPKISLGILHDNYQWRKGS